MTIFALPKFASLGKAVCLAIALTFTPSIVTNIGSVEADDQAAQPAYETITVRGRVVWMAEALSRRFGIKTVREAEERLVALETNDGQLIPIVEDVRGRAFRKDERLMQMQDVELMGRRYEGSPMLQIIRMYEYRDDGKFQVDYWCDICAIIMYEYGPCDCCQDKNRLRKTKVDD